MATIYTEQAKNVHRTWFLMTTFLVIIVGLGYFIAYYYNNMAILYIAVIFSLLMNFFSYWYSDKVVLALSRALPADKIQYSELYTVVETLSITAGLPTPRIYIINDQAPNAFATGRNKDQAVVVVTTGLLSLLNKNELEGVIAHELSHIGNRDILLSTIVVVLVGFISILANIFMRGGLGRGRGNDEKGGGLIVVVGIVLVVLSPLVAKLIELAISRHREFLADASGVLLTRYPEGLANALRKIEQANIPMQRIYDATTHLYISDPKANFSTQRIGGKVSALFSTHPPTEERIKAILGTK